MMRMMKVGYSILQRYCLMSYPCNAAFTPNAFGASDLRVSRHPVARIKHPVRCELGVDTQMARRELKTLNFGEYSRRVNQSGTPLW